MHGYSTPIVSWKSLSLQLLRTINFLFETVYQPREGENLELPLLETGILPHIGTVQYYK